MFTVNPMMLPIYIVGIVVGIPVICGTITKIMKLHYAQRDSDRQSSQDHEMEALREIQLGMRELKRRVENLETVLLDRENRR